MTVPIHHLRAILDAFERREIGIARITVDGQNVAASGGGLLVEHFATGTFRAIVNRRSVRIVGEGDSAELAIAAAIAEARAVADEVASVLTVPGHLDDDRVTVLSVEAAGERWVASLPCDDIAPNVIIRDGGQFFAYGFSASTKAYSRNLGGFLAPEAALEALNAHPPTVACCGRLALPPEAP